ncbi:acyl-CoA dehydrogenase [Asanoa ishikariensis]|uniref:Predicted kinase, aminoglycoside phosphotransferase (APT) family n=1 Tax=Asanoa ishikariensis TaxID=137265 RepID=A0A1H3T0Q1_9ACTN|nr:phosphotransferase family protein [Asanoa ishikariensis]GIF63187.1 acyl-CoA dehydrogenase [Asanoa ishikariensis]SDZ43610.1 Predicted kinase, aminoglycoside phosphotransferase (APT) family [Asanoa ishikariensis]
MSLDLAALGRFLASAGVPVAGPLSSDLISGGRSNLTYAVTDGTHRWVVRRPPVSGLTQSAHDVAREWRVVRALQYSAVPVPPVVALCEDTSVLGAPFAVTGFVSGQVVRTREQLDAYPSVELESCVTELVRVLADLHSVDVDEVGLRGLGRPDGFLERQVALWWRQWNEVKSHDLPDADRLHAHLLSTLPDRPAHIGVVHGDYRIDNTLLDASDITKVLAVVDWELATVGDVQTDVALMCVYRQPQLDPILGLDAAWASDRLPDADAIASAYARRRGVDLDHWPFYLALANFKLAVIAQGISYRARQGAAADATSAQAEEAVAPLLAAGLTAR